MFSLLLKGTVYKVCCECGGYSDRLGGTCMDSDLGLTIKT